MMLVLIALSFRQQLFINFEIKNEKCLNQNIYICNKAEEVIFIGVFMYIKKGAEWHIEFKKNPHTHTYL